MNTNTVPNNDYARQIYDLRDQWKRETDPAAKKVIQQRAHELKKLLPQHKCYSDKKEKWCGQFVVEVDPLFPFCSKECKTFYWGRDVEEEVRPRLTIQQMQQKLNEMAKEERLKAIRK